MIVALEPHPLTARRLLDSVTVHLEQSDGILWLRFVVDGDVDEIAWPARKTPGRADDLWRQTCFEAFVAGDEGYVEYNLSPSGQWAGYRFDDYRQGMRTSVEVATILGLDGGAELVALEAKIELPLAGRTLGLSAVIKDVDGSVSYWALLHPSARPDFHHPDSFALNLPISETA